jgi:hypothetical protein
MVNVAADYIVAVCIRYAILLAAGGIVRIWVLAEVWEIPIAVGVLLYALVVIHTEPAARYARRLRRPWVGWMMLSAACAHAFGAAAVYALTPLTEPRYARPPFDGMQFVPLWEYEPALLDVGIGIATYALLAAVWAVLVGWGSRAVWGVALPESRLLQIRKRAAPDAGRIAGG